MTKKVRAWYANGVLTPLEPLEPEEGAEVVELDVAVARRKDLDSAIAEVKAVLEHIYQLPDSHPKKYKPFLNAEDDLIYLEGERRLRERRG